MKSRINLHFSWNQWFVWFRHVLVWPSSFYKQTLPDTGHMTNGRPAHRYQPIADMLVTQPDISSAESLLKYFRRPYKCQLYRDVVLELRSFGYLF